MSKQKNVHPDHYKSKGSGHQGEDVLQKEERERLARERAREEERRRERRREQEKNEK